MPAKDMNELIAWLKANPNKASAGIGAGASNLLTRLLQRETRTQFTLVNLAGPCGTLPLEPAKGL
jgi:hypothetical protein